MIASSDSSVEVILEIGTWNGLGSTESLRKGMEASISKSSKKLFTVESNQQMFRLAQKNLRKFPDVELLYGTLVTSNQLDSENLTEEEVQWFRQDLANVESSPNVLERIPNRIDLLLLDGGEFSTWSEFTILRERITKWLFLDDTASRKNKKVKEWLDSPDNKEFLLVYESRDRNGWACYVRNMQS